MSLVLMPTILDISRILRLSQSVSMIAWRMSSLLSGMSQGRRGQDISLDHMVLSRHRPMEEPTTSILSKQQDEISDMGSTGTLVQLLLVPIPLRQSGGSSHTSRPMSSISSQVSDNHRDLWRSMLSRRSPSRSPMLDKQPPLESRRSH
jgi:hypothetical protein